MKNLLVTGGAGFIGCNFINYMLNKYDDITIINLDKLTYAGSLENTTAFNDNPRYELLQADIGNQTLIEQTLKNRQIDTIVNFAAESHVDRSISGPAAFIETNIVGTFTLLEAARNVWLTADTAKTDYRFHHISTDEVFGTLKQADPAFTETTPYQPNSPYSASKASSDHLVRAYRETYGLPVSISNCSNNYGPYQHPEKFIPTVINACLNKAKIPVYGDGSNIRDWLHVEDHCRAIDLMLSKAPEGANYNVGANNECDNLSIVKLICALMDERYPHNKPHASLIEFVTDRPGHDWRYAIDSSKIQRELDWQPKWDFEAGLTQTIEFFKLIVQ